MTSEGRPPRVAIIGAGITGLAAAHRLISLSPQVRVTVLEASSHAGGIIRTVHRDGFLVELGPDSFITNKPGAIQLCEEIGFSDQLIPTEPAWRRSLVLRNGKPQPVPDGFMLMAPSRPWSVMTSPVLSITGKLRLLGEWFVPRRRSKEDECLASFVRRRFGREALERLVQPLVGGIYTSDPEKLSLQATLPRFPEMEERYGSVIRATLKQAAAAGRQKTEQDSGSGARYGLFLTAKQGLTQLTDAVVAACLSSGRVQLELNRRVRSIRRSESLQDGDSETQSGGRKTSAGWSVTLDDHSEGRKFDSVIMTLPTHPAANLFCDPEYSELQKSLRAIEYASSAIVVSAHRLSDFTHPLDAFGLVIPDIERRKILAVSFSSRKFSGRAPEGKVLLRTFVGGAMQPELLNQSDEEIRGLVNQELRAILGMSQMPEFSDVVRYENAMPQYHVGHLQRVASIEKCLAVIPGLLFAGSAYYGVGIPDSISSGRMAAESVVRGLQAG